MTTEQHSPEWLIKNADHGIAFEVACAAALTRLLAENAELQRQLEAIGTGGVGPLMHPAAQQPSFGYRRAVMGFGRVAVGQCKAADNQMPGIIYLDMGGEQRDPDTPCDDLFQPGTAADPSKILACIHFSTAASVWQTIDVLHELLETEFGIAQQPPKDEPAPMEFRA